MKPANKAWLWQVVIMLVVLLVPAMAFAFPNGDGTPENPYWITTADHLNTVREAVYRDKHFILKNDIDLTGYGVGYDGGLGWQPIGAYAFPLAQNSFTGSLDGDGFTIRNLYINRPLTDYIGLFGYTGYSDGTGYPNKATIRNVKLEGVNITGKGKVGGLVGYAIQTTISDVSIKGNDVGAENNFAGGLAGYSSSSYISDTLIEGNVTGVGYVGGLTGGSNSTDIDNSSALGSVTGSNDYVGGLIGAAQNLTYIIKSFSSGTVTGADRVGGLVGETNSNSLIQNSYSMNDVLGNSYVGGLVGYNIVSSIQKTYAMGRVTGNINVGGLLGALHTGYISDDINYWDKDTSEQTESAGGTGKTTVEMQTMSTFETWDFETVWGLNPEENNGYPFLRWQGHTHVPPDFAGKGTVEEPYEIESAEQLNKVRNYLDKHFVLVADIDFDVAPYNTGLGWEPIGINTAGNRFTGSFDGGGYTISNLYINRSTNFVGLFGWIQGYGTIIRNVRLEAVNVTGGDYVGGLVGVSYTSADISDSYVEGSVTGNQYVGGLVGHTYQSWTNSSQAEVNVLGVQSVGGLIGYTSSSEIYDSYALGNVTGTNDDVGGLIGYAYWHTAVERNYSGGAVSGDSNVGGLVGRLSHSDYTTDNSRIRDSFSISTVNGNDYVGGLVGQNSRLIERTYAVGMVSGNDNVGGLVGANEGTINSSFWDTESTGQGDSDGGTGLNTAQMQTLATYTDWDFDTIWGINAEENNAYPFLRWQGFSHEEPVVEEPITFAGGDGTENDPFQVATAAQLDLLRNYRGEAHANTCFIQIDDIDLGVAPWNEGAGWEPIGGYYDNISFRGKYDGSGFIISNLTINTTETETYPSLFGRVGYTAELKNIKLENVSITGVSHIGGLVGELEGGTIRNSYVTGSITLTEGSFPWYTGGLVGSFMGLIENSYADVSISSISGEAEKIGGLVGYMGHATIRNSYATGDVAGQQYIGGLVGQVTNDITIENSYATGAVSGTTDTGGLVGDFGFDSTMINSYYNQTTTGQSDTGKGEPRTTAQMKDQATYAGWDFPGTWTINGTDNDGYPALSWQRFVHEVVSDDADLANLTSDVSFNETFDPGTTSYTATVQNSTSAITITPTLNDSSATLKINGSAHTNSVPKTVFLAVGTNSILIEVTAEDGTTTKTYSITVTRQAATSGGGGGGSYSPPPAAEEAVAIKDIKLTINKTMASINGNGYQLDAAPFLNAQAGRILVPIRFISEALGAKTDWNGKTRQVFISFESMDVILTIRSDTVWVNGTEVRIDCPAELHPAGRTFVPLRFISELLGAKVDYSHETKGITITK